MNVQIDDILDFVFDDSFDELKPKLAKKIREEKMYKTLVEEIRILKEKFKSLEMVKKELRKKPEKTRCHITEILTKKNDF